MKITFITLFPEYYEIFTKHSITKKAIEEGKIQVEIINPRDFATNGKVDDYMYGGGAGMLMMIEPLVNAIKSIRTDDSYVVVMGPKGITLNNKVSRKLSNKKHIIIITGHYEGIDSRIKHYIDEEISIGNFILTGGELPSMILADALVRLVPNVIKEESQVNESFENNKIEHDQFTKPINFEGHIVPEVFLNGNHTEAIKWKEKSSIQNTIDKLLKEERNK